MRSLLVLFRAFLLPSPALMAENLALRQQLHVLKRQVKRPRLRRRDRIFWVLMRRIWSGWRRNLVLVKPETVVGWHRQGWRLFWRLRSRGPIGRPPIERSTIALIRRLSSENPLWGAPRIRDELRLLGIELSVTTVAKYMVRYARGPRAQRWGTFLRNHARQIAACDFFVVPSATFKLLYGMVILDHGRRRIVHTAVTSKPSDVWVAAQVRAAYSDPARERPRFLLRDNDGMYGPAFRGALKELGIGTLKTTPGSPWQNGHCERVIGSLRRECFDHVIVMGERGMRRVFDEYVAYYNCSRTHRGLEGNSPRPRWVAKEGRMSATPVLGGLHHIYQRAA